MLKFIVVFLALFVVVSQVYGQAFMAYGPGVKSCGNYVKVMEGYRLGNSSDKAERVKFFSWFLGFASARSFFWRIDALYGKDFDTVEVWLEKYCREHPLDDFLGASWNLLMELEQKR